MARLNISYDLLSWESAILHAGLWKRIFEMLRERGLLEKPETGPLAGCWILPFGEDDGQTEEGEHISDKVFVKRDGTATYAAKDIGYQMWKFGLTDDPQIGVQFHFAPWGHQQDGRMLWTMRAPQDAGSTIAEADPKRFGHAKRAINVVDVRQSYPQQVVNESLRRLGDTKKAYKFIKLSYEDVTLLCSPTARPWGDNSA